MLRPTIRKFRPTTAKRSLIIFKYLGFLIGFCNIPKLVPKQPIDMGRRLSDWEVGSSSPQTAIRVPPMPTTSHSSSPAVAVGLCCLGHGGALGLGLAVPSQPHASAGTSCMITYATGFRSSLNLRLTTPLGTWLTELYYLPTSHTPIAARNSMRVAS